MSNKFEPGLYVCGGLTGLALFFIFAALGIELELV